MIRPDEERYARDVKPVRVLIVDDEQLVRHALRVFLAADARVDLVGEASDGGEAFDACRRLSPDVVLMDIKMPTMGGIEATKQIADAGLPCRVLALTTFTSEWRVIELLRLGASGYLVKDSAPGDVIDAILRAHAGEQVISPVVRGALGAAESEAVDRRGRSMHTRLTDRETRVIELIADGLSNAEIADVLHFAEATVKADINRINHKWGVSNRMQVVLHAVGLGIVEL